MKRTTSIILGVVIVAIVVFISTLILVFPRLPLSEEKRAMMTEKTERVVKDAHAAFSHYRTVALEYEQHVCEHYSPWNNENPVRIRRFYDIQAAYQSLGQEATRFARELDGMTRGEFRIQRNELSREAERFLEKMESSKDILREPYEDTREDRHRFEKTLKSFKSHRLGFPDIF